MHRSNPRRGYTLVELMIGMTLAAVIMLGVLNSYLFLARNSTRLSYHHALEIEARTILYTLGTDVRNTKYILNASGTDLSLLMLDGTTVTYSYSSNNLTRDPGTGAVSLLDDIKGEKVQVPVTMPGFGFYYNNTRSTNPALMVPLTVKELKVNLTLQAGSAGVQDNVGTLTQYQIASGWLLFRNKQLTDGVH